MQAQERFHTIFSEEQPDRAPFCLWLPVSLQFMSFDSLKAASLAWIQAFDSDLVRVPGTSSYPFPLQLELDNPKLLAKIKTKTANETNWLHRRSVFEDIQRLSNNSHALAETVYGPLACLERLCPKEIILEASKNCPGILKAALSAIGESLVAYLTSLGKAGVDAYFLELPSCSHDHWDEPFYREFGTPFDRLVLEETSGIRSILVPASSNMFSKLIANYAADLLLVPPQQSEASLNKLSQDFSGLLAGGIATTILKNQTSRAIEHHLFSLMDSPRFSLLAQDQSLPYDFDFGKLQFVAKALHKRPPKLKPRSGQRKRPAMHHSDNPVEEQKPETSDTEPTKRVRIPLNQEEPVAE